MTMNIEKDKLILITGGHGFIGSHVARRLYDQGVARIRVVDRSAQACIEGNLCHEFIQTNLCDPSDCRRVTRGVHTVLHFAANMGGMGTIHDDNDFFIYNENHAMTSNLLQACVAAGVKRFFYASSACVYPESLQADASTDVSLQEHDIQQFPPRPQGLYGLEKLHSEFLVQQFTHKMEVRIARFHNVYGPGGSWRDGREKAPAAMLRKAIALKLLGDTSLPFEIWGTGEQRRSFLYIEDAVESILALLHSSCSSPVNIGSEQAITIKQLADVALQAAGSGHTQFAFDTTKPVGVASRNSNNEFSSEVLGWSPTTSLITGMRSTGAWIEKELRSFVNSHNDAEQTVLRRLLNSKTINLESETIVFAILLPITSRGSDDSDSCLRNLRQFAHSLNETTWRDTHTLGGTNYRVAVYLAVDHDDHFLFSKGRFNKPEAILHDEGIVDVTTIVCDHPRGHVCKLWRDCARAAWMDGCHYMVLLGDDVVLEDEGWMRNSHAEFLRLVSEQNVPAGFGCVAFTDTSFPGMPTFPIIHRTHLDIFRGEVVPPVFINQDGDPFLFQLYRRWGCSVMFPARIRNGIGGETAARYTKEHATGWTFEPLSHAVASADLWMREHGFRTEKKLTLDIVIPCYRVNLSILDKILALEPSESCTVMFIIIIDDPASPSIDKLQSRYSHRPDVRIRVNPRNMGASESRNRGMQESSAEWVHFLDDDIVPRLDLLKEAEKVIRKHPDAAGFVGNVFFPQAETIFTTAVHLAGVTFFWDIASKIDTDVPWGVTANLIARRDINDGVIYDSRFPKTGGGEDIDFCRKKRAYSIANGGQGFVAAPSVAVTHPWWGGGSRSYWRFYMWSVGDGALVKLYDEHCYRALIPNSAESLFLCGVTLLLALACAQWSVFVGVLRVSIVVVVANVVHDCYRHLWRDADRVHGLNTTLSGLWWGAAVVESSFVRMFSEIGRLRGMLVRREFLELGKRFDWFTGRWGDGPIKEEISNARERFLLAVFFYITTEWFL